jgi:hypothetical protein
MRSIKTLANKKKRKKYVSFCSFGQKEIALKMILLKKDLD